MLRAIADGRLARSIVRHGKRFRIVDEDLALEEYRGNTREYLSSASDTPADYQTERTKKIRADAALAELKLKQQRRELVPISEISRVTGEALSSLRRRMLSIPDRLSVELAATTDAREIRTLLRDEVRSILDSAADAIAKGVE